MDLVNFESFFFYCFLDYGTHRWWSLLYFHSGRAWMNVRREIAYKLYECDFKLDLAVDITAEISSIRHKFHEEMLLNVFTNMHRTEQIIETSQLIKWALHALNNALHIRFIYVWRSSVCFFAATSSRSNDTLKPTYTIVRIKQLWPSIWCDDTIWWWWCYP